MAVADQARTQASVSRKPALAWEGVTYRLVSVLLMIAVWQAISLLVSPKYVPGPMSTVMAVAKHAASGALWGHFLATIVRMVSSFALAMIVGVAAGILMGLFRRGEQMLDLWVMVGLTIPGLCYVIVSFLWLGLNDRAAILAISWTTFPSIAINIWQGVKAIDQRLVDMARVFRASRWRRTVRVVLPQVLPYLMAATRFGLGVVWKVTVLVELLGRSDGIGYMLNYSFQMFNMADVFAWTLSFTVFMVIIELGILKPLERKLFRWRPEISG
ncbi:MAG: ABC transporter permease [Candidatus Tectomicrobia bacterium]|uniref:ABC transporter permease n=1 Tax=Tectimicrobiota bacterium TaxID=2528274 RepID=A0A932GMD6_UNCTE|nr:ABC transporter permease [Candidatus Tectomicrobia bacterium]